MGGSGGPTGHGQSLGLVKITAKVRTQDDQVMVFYSALTGAHDGTGFMRISAERAEYAVIDQTFDLMLWQP